ncbi:acyltransferase family protein [Microbacterium sp. CCNWLW134]|uniref:acyltransferase family protein n=1 Tax=Microbacterium sp. CCNWLW134 TaxID=3122064 RepID=UPI00300F8C9C
MYRADIDGLRALAILLVVVYHVWFSRVSGGVDVFLMISAFLLTVSFLNRVNTGNALGIRSYWLRKSTRLLPAAAVTLIGVLAIAYLLYPPTLWMTIWRQTWASLFYAQNWELAFQKVDYYARADSIPSPLQHFWSLSVQGQVFVLWPLIFLVVGLVIRRTSWRADVMLWVIFSVIFVGSLAFSISETASNQEFAYFDTRTRLWEFAVGSLVALALPYFRAPAVLRAVAGWVGVAGIVACGIVIDVQGGFPGYLALWPVGCTAAVILAGGTPAPGGPTPFLSSRPLRWLGRDAYSLYLVHWPILITWMVVSDVTSVDPLAGLVIIALSFALAHIIARGVEGPLRRLTSSDGRAAVKRLISVVCVVAVALPTATWQTIERLRAGAISEGYVGAAALRLGHEPYATAEIPLVPDPTALGEEWVTLDSSCAGPYRPSSPLVGATCYQLTASDAPTAKVVVVGDSHAQQWMGALVPLAEARHWDVVAVLRGGCSFAVDEPPVPGAQDCEQWRDAAGRYIDRLNPDLVFGMATKTAPGGEERVLRGLRETVDRLGGSGTEVVLFRDNPRFATDPFTCVIENGPQSLDCRVDRTDALARTNPAAGAAGDAHLVDLSDFLCPGDTCLPVIGNIAVYIDDNHLSGSYARTLAPMLEEELVSAGVIDGD